MSMKKKARSVKLEVLYGAMNTILSWPPNVKIVAWIKRWFRKQALEMSTDCRIILVRYPGRKRYVWS